MREDLAVPPSPLAGPASVASDPSALPPAIDASCRAAVVFLAVSSALWLVLASVGFLFAALKFHLPGFLSGPFTTYGRLYPAASNAFLYGFALPAGWASMLWLLCRLGRAPLEGRPLIFIGTVFWNLGVTVAFLGILAGEGTGFEWLELPAFSMPILFVAYGFIALGAVLTFRARRQPELYVSQWFLLAAIFWFPWVYTTSCLLLVHAPVRGTLQAVVNWWYINHLALGAFGFIGLAVILYLVPKITARPLHSYYGALFAFWLLVWFGGWSGIPAGAPVPAWIPSLSTVGSVFLILPTLAIAENLRRTLKGHSFRIGDGNSLSFVLFGAAAFAAAFGLQALASIRGVSAIVRLTLFDGALRQLYVYGFFAMTVFGAVYYFLPRLLQTDPILPHRIRTHFYLSAIGLAIIVLAGIAGGVAQGVALQDPYVTFLATHRKALLFLRISMLGELLVCAANICFFLNVMSLLGAAVRRTWPQLPLFRKRRAA